MGNRPPRAGTQMKRILITGGTGSLGHALIPRLLADPAIERVLIFSRGEKRQKELIEEFPDSRVTCFLGDIRDDDRIYQVMRGVDAVIHAAAMKDIVACAWDPDESEKTNVDGTRNVRIAALERGVKKMLFISTDKAVAATTKYGKDKASAEDGWLLSNVYRGSESGVLSVIRYGNVCASNGSVIPIWRKLAAQERPLPLTHPDMTRFWITLPEAAAAVMEALRHMEGGEVFVPKMPAFRLIDLAAAIYPHGLSVATGIRTGEKLHEDMITVHEARQVHEEKNVYVILPSDLKPFKSMPDSFRYASNSQSYLTINELQERLRHV
jgi:UDP-N-acetylglucosamine 4,6-dehydratase/5-epimerase